jgi:hypothetical protein
VTPLRSRSGWRLAAWVAVRGPLNGPRGDLGLAYLDTDQLTADHLIEASDLDWTMLRATRLTNGLARRPARLSTGLFTRGPYSLSRTACATALLDLAEGRSHPRQVVNITG